MKMGLGQQPEEQKHLNDRQMKRSIEKGQEETSRGKGH